MRIPTLADIAKQLKGASDKKRIRTIYQIADKHRKALLMRENVAVDRMLGAWRIAEASMLAELKIVTDQIEAAILAQQEVSLGWLYRQDRYQVLLDTIAIEIGKYGSLASNVATAQQAASISMALVHSKQLVRASGIMVNFKSLPVGAFENMVGFLHDASPLADLFMDLGPQSLEKANIIFAEGLSKNKGPRVIAKQMERAFDMTKTRSLTIARTESLRAYRTAAQQNYEANSNVVTAGRWSSSRDGRTCYLCLAKDGTIIPHGERMAAHVGCRCSVVPVVKFLNVDRGTGEEWLEKQPEEVQLDKLGPARFERWKAKRISLQDMATVQYHPRWGNSVRSVPIEQIDRNLAYGIKAPEPKRSL